MQPTIITSARLSGPNREPQKDNFRLAIKAIFLTAALILGTAAFPQVGINTSTPTATLDIRSTDQAAPSNTDGLLIPKIDTFPAVNPTAAQQGMMVYLTTTSGTDAPGFYYWDNTTSDWIGIGASTKGWDLSGNLGTNPATHFIGTTDAEPVVLKTDNAERMRIDASGKIGIGTASPQNKFHVYNGASAMTPNPFSVATFEDTVSAYVSVLSAGETGVLFGANGNSTNGAIVYNNPGLADGMLFRTNGNINRMVIGPTGNIGFGNFVPSYPLQFPNAHGDKVALWGGAGVHYGLGIQAGLLQIYTDGAGSDVAFGYGTSAAMTETMRVKGNGRVGVGIGLPNARMEVAASSMATPANTDGLIIPRVNAFPASNPTAAQNGMLVFLTTTAGAFQPGFYYWNNPTSTWKGIGSSGTPNDWGLAGNAGTTPANNFIGTTDNNDLVFKRNNVRAGLIGASNTSFGSNSLNPATTGNANTAFGSIALVAVTSGFRNVAIGSNTMTSQLTGSYNTAVGTSAMASSTNGGSNTAVGDGAMSGLIGGTFNVGVGNNTLNANAEGDGNTALGHRAMFAGTSGDSNTAVGNNALYNNQASQIVGIGFQALVSNTTGTFNTAVGTSSLALNQTGTSNTAVGHSALANNTGSFNTAMGLTALGMNTSGIQNTAFGYQSLINNTTGNANVAVGHNALFHNLTASSVVAVGNVALFSNTTGINNNAVGGGALYSNTTGNNNTSMGAGSLYHSNGDYNTAFGSNALVNNTAGYDNTSNGAFSLAANTLGFRNTAQGGAALQSNTLGNYNVASGYFALGSNQIGVANTAIGSYAGLANVGGNDNTVLGYQGLHDNIDGNYNLAAGANANFHNTSGDNNTALGNAAMSNTTSGDNNTAVGANAMVTQTSGNNNIAIGFNSALPSLAGSNQMSIGNVVYGSGMDSAANAKIGIGKQVPDAKMDIAASNAAAPANTDGLLIPRVFSFPVTNPTAAQNGMMIYLSTIVGAYAAGFYYWDSASVSWLPVGGKTGWSIYGTANTNPTTHFIGTSDNSDVSLRANGAEAMRLEVGGNVGIGTNNPTTKLEVNGFTKLGSNAPAIKNLKLTGTSANAQGNQVGIAHGLNSSKILSVSVMMEWSAGQWIPASYGATAGYEFDYFVSGTNVQVINKTANSVNILSKPIKILITYEE